MIKVANCCGGRGSNTIIRELSRYPYLQVTNIVNAYDDGKSTGHIRKFFRMPGPSDIRKNQLAMMSYPFSNGDDVADPDGPTLNTFFRFRFPETAENGEAASAIEKIACGHEDAFGLCTTISEISPRKRDKIRKYLLSFIENVTLYEKVLGDKFPYGDCSIANCLYAGAFELYDRDFAIAVDQIGKILGMCGETITNTDEDGYLAAVREDGYVMNSEAEIVESRANVRIHELFIVERPLTATEKRNLDSLPMVDKIKYLRRFSRVPRANKRCLEVLSEADIILFSPGTQHSSLYPTYIAREIGETIRQNRDALKIFIANIGEDYETPAYSVSQLVQGALRYLENSNPGEHCASSYINFVFANNSFLLTEKQNKYVAHDPESVQALGVECISDAFEDPQNPGKHDGHRVVRTMLELLENSGKHRRG